MNNNENSTLILLLSTAKERISIASPQLCSFNTSAVFEQPSELVPDGAFFLTYAECGMVERVGTVPVGTKLVLIPMIGETWYDVDDDINSNNPDCPARNTSSFQESVEEEMSVIGNLTYYTKEPFATVDGKPLVTFYLIYDKEYYYKACPNDPDKGTCDGCDANFDPPDGCSPFAGMDVYPLYGWAAFDESEWKSGETRTYNFGATLFDSCLDATYTLTAAEDGIEATGDSSNTAAGVCGMFSALLSLFLMPLMVL